MTYFKVRWLHQFETEPIILLSELDGNRLEVRKIEIFRDGRLGYASENIHSEGTMLGELPIPPAEEITNDPQFVIENLTKAEFETAWENATSQGAA